MPPLKEGTVLPFVPFTIVKPPPDVLLPTTVEPVNVFAFGVPAMMTIGAGSEPALVLPFVETTGIELGVPA